jgi:putative glycosyltransferase
VKISIVSTLYYSQSYLQEFCQRCIGSVQKLTHDFELILVNDGSPDQSLSTAVELQKIYPSIVVVDLTRNFGHHRAIMTGLRHASGDLVFLIDSDLEESPELLETFFKEMQGKQDVDVVFGIQNKRKGNWFERISGIAFYKLLSILSAIQYPANTFTARLMTKRYVNSVLSYSEKELDIWGVFVLTGYNQIGVTATKGFKGKSSYSLYKKIRMAIEIITSLSHRPLYFTFILGIITTFVSLIIIGFLVYNKLIHNINVEGWASILASVWLFGGLILLVLGVIGIYLSKIFLEIKNRPLSLIKKIYNSNDQK